MCQQATSARSSLIRPLVGAGPQHHGCTILDILASFLQHSGDVFSIVSQLSWFRLLTVCWSLCNWKHMFHGTRRIMFPACCSQKTYRGKNATRGEVLPGVMLRLRYFFLYSFDFSTFESYTCCTVGHLTTKSCGNCFTLDLIQRMNRGCNTCTKIYINAIISLCVLAFYSTHEIWNETGRGVKVLILSFSLKLFTSTQDADSSPPNQVVFFNIWLLCRADTAAAVTSYRLWQHFAFSRLLSSKTHDQLDWGEVTDLISQQHFVVLSVRLESSPVTGRKTHPEMKVSTLTS